MGCTGFLAGGGVPGGVGSGGVIRGLSRDSYSRSVDWTRFKSCVHENKHRGESNACTCVVGGLSRDSYRCSVDWTRFKSCTKTVYRVDS